MEYVIKWNLDFVSLYESPIYYRRKCNKKAPLNSTTTRPSEIV